MGTSTANLSHFVREFAKLRGRMKDFAQVLRATFPSASVQHSVDFVTYERGDLIEIFIEVTFSQGHYLCWWIDVEAADGHWRIGASLDRDRDSEKETLWHQEVETSAASEPFVALSQIIDEIEQFAVERAAELRSNRV